MRRFPSALRYASMRAWILLLCPFLSVFHTLKAQKAEVEQILAEVNLDSLLFTVQQLTGIEPAMINGQPQKIYSRYISQTPNAWAGIYLQNRLRAYGYTISRQLFSASGENIIAYKEGNLYPNKAFVICAHYDAIAIPYDQAVGADDNASGCAAVMEAARLLKDSDFPFSLYFVFFDEEEQGLIGSNAFQEQFDYDQHEIRAVFNLDMIAYDDNLDNRAEIHTRPYANSIELANKIIGLNDTFQIGLDLSIKNPGTTASDHDAFWQNDKTAILLIEDKMDFNRYYHTKFDSIQYFHDSFFFKNTQFAIAALCWFASDKDNTLQLKSMEEPELSLYPNPTSGKLTFIHEKAGNLSIYSMDGRLLSTFSTLAGHNEISLDPVNEIQHVIVKFRTEEHAFRPKLLLLTP